MSGVPDICLHNICLGKKQKDCCTEKAKKTTAYPSTVSCTTIAVSPDSIPSWSEYISSVTWRVRGHGNAFLGWPFLASFSSCNSNCELLPTYKASSDSASGQGKARPIGLRKSVCMASMSSWRTRGRCASHVARNRLYVPVWVSDPILRVGHSLLHLGMLWTYPLKIHIWILLISVVQHILPSSKLWDNVSWPTQSSI